MNREIKFRWWDNYRKVMRSDFDGFDENLGINEMLKYLQENDFIIMQYTGLKDKNGRDIYEGDIVKETYPDYDDDDAIQPNIIHKTRQGVVEYRGRGFWVDSENFGWEGENLWHWDHIAVVGNVYEQPKP